MRLGSVNLGVCELLGSYVPPPTLLLAASLSPMPDVTRISLLSCVRDFGYQGVDLLRPAKSHGFVQPVP